MEVLVLFDYDGQADDELTIRKGDVILEVKKQDGGWWEGLLGSKRGVFPDNFVTVVSEAEMSSPLLRTGAGRGRRCKVLFSYHPSHDDELPLAVGDEIQLLGEVEEGWWRGRLAGKVGVFPSNFVSMLEESPSTVPNGKSSDVTSTPTLSTPDVTAPKLPPKPVRDIARVLYSYIPQHPDELELKEGDMITILLKDVEDKGWWRGELNGKIGVFPDNFVELIPQRSQSSSSPETSSTNGQNKPERPPPIPVSSPVALSKTVIPESRSSLLVSNETLTKPQAAIQIFDKVVTTNGTTNPSIAPSNSLSDEQKLLQVGNAESVDFSTVIKPTAMLSHPAKVKPVKRRPPSSVFIKDLGLNGGPESPAVNDENLRMLKEEPGAAVQGSESTTQMETSPKAKSPVVKPPWFQELKKNQEKRVGGVSQENKPPLIPLKRVVSKAEVPPASGAKVALKTSSPENGKPTGLKTTPATTTTDQVPVLGGKNSSTIDGPLSLPRRDVSPKPTGDVHEELVSLRHRVRDLEGTVQSLREELLALKQMVEEGHVLHL